MFLRPGTLDEALQALGPHPRHHPFRWHRSVPCVHRRPVEGPDPRHLGVSTNSKAFAASPDFFHIGARITWSELLAAPLPRGFDGLRAAAREIGSIQIQNQATIAGNICNASPAADGVAALLALDAEITLASQAGTRNLPLAEFVQGNRKTARRADEILTSIRIPRRWEERRIEFS